jgi:hypothetical protein
VGEDKTFDDVLDAITEYAHDDSDDFQPVDTPEVAPTDAETPEAPSEDTPEDQPAESDETEDKAPEDTEAKDEGETAEETPAKDTPQLDDEVVAYHDEDGNPVTLGELRKGYLRQSDYTRKRQEEAEAIRRLESERETERELARLVATDQYAREFVELFPNHADRLFKDPQSAIELIKDRSSFEAFVKRVNALDDDPELAQAYIDSKTNQSARQELDNRVAADEVRSFGQELAKTVTEIGKEFEGVTPDNVTLWVFKSAGVDPLKVQEAFNSGDTLAVRDDMARVAAFVTRQRGENFEFNTDLFRDRFEYESLRSRQESGKQDAHNDAVDKQLAAQANESGVPHVDGSAADGPGAEDPLKSGKYKTLDDWINRDDGPLSVG